MNDFVGALAEQFDLTEPELSSVEDVLAEAARPDAVHQFKHISDGTAAPEKQYNTSDTQYLAVSLTEKLQIAPEKKSGTESLL